MNQSIADIVEDLKTANKRVQVIYAFNGTGKTRLSREFRLFVAPKDAEGEEEADEERPADIIAEIDAEETLEEHENKEPEENANASDTDDTDGSSNTAINKATDFS